MQETRFRPVAVQLARAILFWGLAGALLVGLLQGLYTQREAEARLQRELHRYVTLLASHVAAAVFEVNREGVRDQLELALMIRGVGYVAAVEAGSVVAEAGDLSRRQDAHPLSFPIVVSTERASRYQHVALVTGPGGRQFGDLKIVVDRAALDSEVFDAVLRAVLPCLMVTGLVLASALMLVRGHLQRPMRQIAAFLDRLDAGQLGERLRLDRRPARAHDEIDLVAAGFGAMQDRIVGHVRELDARVVERTEALQTALDRLKTLAVTDPLTACSNRLAFTQKYPEAIAHAERYGRPLSVVFCDVDRFKSINDVHGHPVGDRVLAAIGHCLRGSLRVSSDWVARYGGEEFVLVLPETSLSQAHDFAERLRRQIECVRVELPGGTTLGVTASLGVAEYRSGERAEDLLSRADEQLYAAKQGGRNRVMPPLAVVA